MKEDIDVTLTDDTITIAGEKKKEEKVSKNNYYRFECSYGSFARSFTLMLFLFEGPTTSLSSRWGVRIHPVRIVSMKCFKSNTRDRPGLILFRSVVGRLPLAWRSIPAQRIPRYHESGFLRHRQHMHSRLPVELLHGAECGQKLSSRRKFSTGTDAENTTNVALM